MNKVLIVHNQLPEYRRRFFQLLGHLYKVELFITEQKPDSFQNVEGVEICQDSGLGLSALRKRLDKKDYQAVVTGNWDTYKRFIEYLTVWWKSRRMGIPCVVWSEEWQWQFSFARKMMSPVIAITVKQVEAVVVPGERSKKHFLNMGVLGSRVFTAPNASQLPTNSEDILQPDKVRIICLARFIPRKGIDILCRAFSKIDCDAQLVLMGNDDPDHPGYREKIQSLVNQLGMTERVIISHAPSNRSEMAVEISKGSIVVVPSLNKPMGEPWGLIVNEAMQLSKPIIVSDAVGSGEDLVQHGVNGFVVPAGQVEPLAKAIEKICSNESLIKVYGKRSKEIIALNSYNGMAEGFSKALDKVLS
ncbi:MAG: glycosyltransferase family 4 protein [bacterium]